MSGFAYIFNNTITLTAAIYGSAGDYPILVSSSGDFWAGSTVSALQGGQTAATFYDSGSLSVVVNDAPVTVSWGQGSTAASIAASLASAIHTTAGDLVSATSSGSGATATVALTSVTGGAESDWPVSVSVADTGSNYQSAANTTTPSFSASATSMSGGASTTGNVLYSFSIPDQGGYDPAGRVARVLLSPQMLSFAVMFSR